MPLEAALIRIDERIAKGDALPSKKITNEQDLDTAWRELSAWSDFNADLLKRIVDSEALADDYERWRPLGVSTFGGEALAPRISRWQNNRDGYLAGLRSLRERLQLADELAPSAAASPVRVEPSRNPGRRVFVVHGHDELAKQEVARCLEKLRLDAIILHEQANQGRTLIEKVEAFKDVDFAVVILTPDDLGRARAEPPTVEKPRPRQNVLVELGFFAGALGRARVCALHKGDVDIPSDFHGVTWVEMDARGRWQFDLVKELNAAKIPVDANALLGDR